MGKQSGLTWLGGMLVGVTAMYFLDPRFGPRRRAEVGRQAVNLIREVEQSLAGPGGDVPNRPPEQAARPAPTMLSDLVADHRLEARVRTVVSHLATRPGSIQTHVREGVVRLAGSIPEAELGDVITGVRRVPGVLRVESQLQPVQRLPASLPAAYVEQSAEMQARSPLEPLSPPARALVGAAGGLLALWGLKRGGASGVAGAALGGWMVARSVVEETAHPWIAAGGPPSAVLKTLDIAAPLNAVFAAWTDFSSFPIFMAHVREVRESENGISHWTADGPAGLPVSWNAEITALQPFRRVAWRSLPGSVVWNAGEVQFEDVSEALTRIHVRMVYQPPAGRIGRAVAACFGADPERQVDEDLRRFKRLLETGRSEPAEPLATGIGAVT